jgi:hypothetical protein
MRARPNACRGCWSSREEEPHGDPPANALVGYIIGYENVGRPFTTLYTP